ncbi:hypothetical protein GALMADRAFT_219385 [Galerina marginata CBS 339.88]|uniref:Uncharacterized protein n=1 Tax=Galerina marginata (strain CBS 339.88) TaxID=685588 RepID=A0A067TUI1_GALM3|nr:hypothetical protein GALMADRAFT_219385 [Galerina marginata CBS 339.88]
MSDNDEWTELLRDHPIFSLPKSVNGSQNALELSTNTLPVFTSLDPVEGRPVPPGRRQVMTLKDADLIVAAGKEIRMSSFGDLKLSHSVRKSYKTLHTPNIQFEIHQIALNPSGKLLAVAGAYQVAVIVLPRVGYSRLVPESIDCKAVQVGQFYHAANNSAPIAKLDWHPWGDAGSTLLVMSVDGKLREYDISVDTEEPQQVLTFIPEKKAKSFMADDNSEREVASFTLGKGRADWGPLTVYAVTRSGDIYSICPYMPQNASIPSSYIHSLECFISAKQEFLAQGTSSAPKILSTIYDYQHKYITALVKQLPPGTVFPATSKAVLMHPPTTIKSPPLRQGPFLLQPSPRILEGSEGGDATDITYLAFGTDEDDPDDDARDTEHLGVMLVSYQDGKVDLFLDVEKVEARWDTKQVSRDLPMLAVYENIDLGLVTMLCQISVNQKTESLLELLRANHPVFLLDPLHDDMVYVYHAFGVHSLDISPVLMTLSAALREENEDESLLKAGLEKAAMTNVQPILTTFSVERKCSNPVIGIAIPNDVYLTYSIFILTSVMRITSFALNIRSQTSLNKKPILGIKGSEVVNRSKWLTPPEGPPSYVSMLGNEPYTPPSIIANRSGIPNHPKLSLPGLSPGSKEFMLTPDTLRFIGQTVAQIGSQVQAIHLAYQGAVSRVHIQKKELELQSAKCREMEELVEKLKGSERQRSEARFSKIQEEQKLLLARFDRLLQALMKQASPELSEHETKWFEELKRMKADVLGVGRYDEESLVARTRMLEKEYGRILPPLQSFLEKEKERGKKHAESTKTLGFSQAFEYGERSNFDRSRIVLVEKELTKLATELDLPLGQPPS